MEKETPRSGIEKRILASILWFGILPLSFIFISGYFLIRDWQRQLAEDALRTALAKTTGAFRTDMRAQEKVCDLLASTLEVRHALSSLSDMSEEAGNSTHAVSTERLRDLLRVVNERSPWKIAVVDERNRFIATSSGFPSNLQSLINHEQNSLNGSPSIRFFFSPEALKVFIVIVRPVIWAERTTPVGLVLSVADVNELVSRTLDAAAEGHERGLGHYQYQTVYPQENACWKLVVQPEHSSAVAADEFQQLDKSVVTQLAQGLDSNDYQILRLSNYPFKGKLRPVFAACGRLFDDSSVFLVVSRTEASIFWKVNRTALGMLAVTLLVIAFLYLNAYRNVHNNIVRNVLLLNEGAQIIGQGDLDLKLKIATGDEIEELAQSFNKMALALKRNIGRLEASEEKYRRLFTSIRDGIIQADTMRLVVLVNPAAAEIIALKGADEITGRPFRELFEECTQLESALDEIDDKEYLERTRIWVTRKDGMRICLEFSGSKLRDDAGSDIGYEVVYRDITKSVQLEREAHERAERISATNQIANVINSSLQAGRLYESLVVEVKKLVDFDTASISIVDESGDRFEMRALWPEEEQPSRQFCSITDENWCAPLVARDQKPLVIDDFERKPDIARPRDFPPYIRSCLSVPLHASGRVIGTFNLGSRTPDAFSSHDIEVLEHIAPHVAVALRNAHLLESLQESLFEAKRAQEKLREAHEELKTLDEMKTNLLSNVSHELRTPLVAVLGYTDMIYNGKAGPVTDKQKEYLGISLRNIEKLVTLIENLLDFSRLHRGSETLVFDTFDLRDCVSASLEIMRPVAESREITLTLQSPEEPVLVRGDKSKLGQVFTNLLSNAVKFNHHGGQVHVAIEMGSDTVDVRVTDTGIGIPPEAQEKVFTRFYQYDSSSTRKYGGAGIGLSIAQDIARLHGTKINLTSEVGKGSTFSLRLPLLSRDRSAKEGQEEILNVVQTRRLIEIVTLDRAFANQIHYLLEAEGIEVIVSSNPEHALSLANRYNPDCLLLDLENDKPESHDYELVIHFAHEQNIPVVIFAGDSDLYESLASSLTMRLKPGFRKSTLLSAIHHVIGYTARAPQGEANRILCIDDDPEVVDFIVRSLEAEGYVVDWCSSGEEALKRAALNSYDVVLLDIAMPGLDGFETCKRLRAIPQFENVKIYMVTAKPVDTLDKDLRDAGFDGFLWKPFKARDLLDLISTRSKGSLSDSLTLDNHE